MNEPITHSWLQSLNDKIDENHREVMSALGRKIDREEIEPRLAALEKSERAQAIKFAGLSATVSAVVIWLKGQLFGAS